MKLGEMMRWTSLEIILKRADKRVRDAYGRMREMLLPGHKLDPKFMELLFKKDFEKSIGMLTAKLDKVREGGTTCNHTLPERVLPRLVRPKG